LVDPAFGPFLFDTSAESWLVRSSDPTVLEWFEKYLKLHSVHVSAITVVERMRGYALLLARVASERQAQIAFARRAYLDALGTVWPIDVAVALVAAELVALLPHPPTPPKRAHKMAESRQERLARWRFDILIAATALVAALPLIHDNPEDFETIRTAIEISPERFPELGPLNLIRTLRLAGS
jgi:predicted nucleic acid-binding protein